MKTYLKCFLFTNKELYKNELITYIEKYHEINSSISKKTLKKDMKKAYIQKLILPNEYYRYRFYDLSPHKRNEYISHKEAQILFKHSKKNTFPRNKYKRYEMFKDFFKREIINITFADNNELKIYEEFCKKNKEFIVKPFDGTEGKDITIVAAKDFPTLDYLKSLTNNKECILEELIIQGKEMAIFHKNSINTIRFVTVITPKGEFHKLYALARFGQGNSIVDNVGAGGIVDQIDINTGVIISDDLINEEFHSEHPDSQYSSKPIEKIFSNFEKKKNKFEITYY